MPQIHPTSVVEAGAELGSDVKIGPHCYVGPKVVLGEGTRLVSHVAILGRTTLGKYNTLWPHASLGAEPQDLKYQGEDTTLVIGDHNSIRESVTIHLGTESGGGVTRVGNDCLIMGGVHIAHDCDIGDHVIMANNVLLAGHVLVRPHVVMSGGAAVHHFATVGDYAFVGGLSRIVHDVPPFMIVEGNPAKVRGVNIIGLQRNRFPEATITALKESYRKLFRRGRGPASLPAASVLDHLQQQFADDACIDLLVQFMRNSAIGVYGRYRETARSDDRRASRFEIR